MNFNAFVHGFVHVKMICTNGEKAANWL